MGLKDFAEGLRSQAHEHKLFTVFKSYLSFCHNTSVEVLVCVFVCVCSKDWRVILITDVINKKYSPNNK